MIEREGGLKPISENHTRYIFFYFKEFDIDVDPFGTDEENEEEEPGKRRVKAKRRSKSCGRVFTNKKFYFGCRDVMSLIASFISQTPMICHHNMESKFVRITRNESACIGLSHIFTEAPINIELKLFRLDQKEYSFWGHQCTIIRHMVTFWTNFFNDPFEKFDQEPIHCSAEECKEMLRTKSCKFGNLVGDPEDMWDDDNRRCVFKELTTNSSIFSNQTRQTIRQN
jgi:hypothetical protein